MPTKKIAFVVGVFPAISEPWLINQVADLMDRGFNIDIYAFTKEDPRLVSERYHTYRMRERTTYIGMPVSRITRVLRAIPKMIRLLFIAPRVLFRALDPSLKFLFWSEQFVGRSYDVIHLHDGHVANRFLMIKDIVGLEAKLITSFYGRDVSGRYSKHQGKDIYARLKQECSAFIVMSNNMKERVVAKGFDEQKIHVLPISFDVNSYPFWERRVRPGEDVNMVSVGRFVEKKGFDDLLRALAIVKRKTDRPFRCTIIGDGPLRGDLQRLANELNLQSIVSFPGSMKLEHIIESFQNAHLYLQPSKTAADGDME